MGVLQYIFSPYESFSNVHLFNIRHIIIIINSLILNFEGFDYRLYFAIILLETLKIVTKILL